MHNGVGHKCETIVKRNAKFTGSDTDARRSGALHSQYIKYHAIIDTSQFSRHHEIVKSDLTPTAAQRSNVAATHTTATRQLRHRGRGELLSVLSNDVEHFSLKFIKIYKNRR